MGILKYVAGLLYSNDKLVSVVGETAVNGGIESGSNANGNWIKYPDGTLIQSGYYSDAVNNPTTITFPIPFHTVSSVTATAINNAARGINVMSVTTTTATILRWAGDTGATSGIVPSFYCTAIGRWKA